MPEEFPVSSAGFKNISVPALRRVSPKMKLSKYEYYLARPVELVYCCEHVGRYIIFMNNASRFSSMKRLLSLLNPKEILIKNTVMYDNQFNNNKFTNHN